MTGTVVSDRKLCRVAPEGGTIQLALVRHAQADFHGHFCGHSDPGLSEEGLQQLPTIIQSLSQIVPRAIWSSDLRRARETAEPIAKYFGLACTTSSLLREMNFGLWEGLTWNQVELQYLEDARRWARLFPHHRPPEGQSFLEFQARVIEQLVQLATQAEPGCTLIVTHAGFIRTSVAWVLGVPDERISSIGVDYGGLTALEKRGNHWTVTGLNVSSTRFRGLRYVTTDRSKDQS